MKKVKRYENDYGAIMGSDDGEWVTYKDYAALEQKLTYLAVQLANAESKCMELAAENAEMRSSIDATIGWQESTDPENGESVRMLVDIKTPTTDAFLDEVRAQGVEMFGQYHNFSEKLFIQKESKKFAAQLRKGAAL